MSRGRLLCWFLAELYRLDTSATAADPDDAGSLDSGYDPEFRETVRVADATWQGASARQEQAAIRVKCQVEVNTFGALQAMLSGHEAESHMVLVFHFRDLERAGLVETSTKDAKIRVHARLTALYNRRSELEQTVGDPGLYAVDAQPASLGLGLRRNLLLVTFKGRDQAVRA
jgi:hypothetical protein